MLLSNGLDFIIDHMYSLVCSYWDWVCYCVC